jgi:hypothetical protein
VGQPAADAAQAVRRAGLKPGLDRSFGCEPELLGQVVAQEPVAGSELARNGMVRLYVAAPGTEPVDGDPDPHVVEDLDDVSSSASPPRTVPLEVDVPRVSPVVRRLRKPGRARRAPRVFDTPPDPLQSVSVPAGETELLAVEAEPVEAGGDGAEDGFSKEEFVVRVEDLFAGRTRRGLPGWRRVYPRKHKLGASGAGGWLTEHRWLVSAVGAMLVLWALVAVVAALAGHPSNEHHPTTLAGINPPALATGLHRPVRPHPPVARAARRTGRRSQVHVVPRVGRSIARPAVKPARRPAVRAVRASAQPARVVADRGPVVPAGSAAPESDQEQHGGPFSP